MPPQMKVTPELGSVPMAWWRETGAPGGALVRGRVRVRVRVRSPRVRVRSP